MRSKRVFFPLVLVILALIMILQVQARASRPEFTDPATPIVIKAGQEFAVILDSNPTTGYSWALAQPLQPEILKLISQNYKPADSTPQPGSGGRETWIFKGLAKGTTSISMQYVRPWEKGILPARSAVFTVAVQ